MSAAIPWEAGFEARALKGAREIVFDSQGINEVTAK
jgi:hypothetical protein